MQGEAYFSLNVSWSDFKPERSLGNTLKMGYLLKQGDRRKNWKRRWFVLDKGSRLMYYDSKETYDAGGSPLNSVDVLGSVVIEKETGRQNLIALETAKRTFYMCGDSHEQKVAWKDALMEAGATSTAL
mgnify:CR=1 FL=1